MIDLKRTLSLVTGGLFNSEQTWRKYLPEAENWQKTALLLTGPLILLAAVAAYIFGFLGSDLSLFGQFRPTIMSTILTVISSAIAAVVIAFVFSLLAGAFGGKNNFALGLAATTFAFIPGYIGQAITWLPWIGGLLAFGLFIYGLVLLWKIIPIYLAVPDGKRAGHYILSLLVSIVVMFVLSMTIGRFLYPSMGGSSGTFGDVIRQAELIAAEPVANISGEYDRKSFVLCPALESYREELSAIVGFEQNPERALAISTGSRKCSIPGQGGDFVGVHMVPAFIKSVELHATKSFDGTASPARELGDDAMYVDNGSQPHVIFRMGPILIDVHAEHYAKTPDRNTMVSLATRVRNILEDAN